MHPTLTILAIIIRITANSALNAGQKKLSAISHSANTNFNTYLILTLFCLPLLLIFYTGTLFNVEAMLWAFIGGFFGAAGNLCLISSLKRGELSILGPVNSYKSIVSLIFGIFLLNEIPSLASILGIILIVAGSYFIFDTTKEGFSFTIFKRKDIQLRLYALVLTAIEAVIIKKVILFTNVWASFFLWVIFGCLFSFLILIFSKDKNQTPPKISKFIPLSLMVCFMQLSTNFVFSKIDVAPALALFQLSGILNVILGYKFFNEKQVLKKLIGSMIMVIGSAIIILKS